MPTDYKWSFTIAQCCEIIWSNFYHCRWVRYKTFHLTTRVFCLMLSLIVYSELKVGWCFWWKLTNNEICRPVVIYIYIGVAFTKNTGHRPECRPTALHILHHVGRLITVDSTFQPGQSEITLLNNSIDYWWILKAASIYHTTKRDSKAHL